MRGEDHEYLRRLPPEEYQGQAFVHWSMTIEDRKTGWLVPIVFYKLREILAHTAFRYGFCCPIYCCMPDHLHLLLIGVRANCDQRNAVRFFRQQMNIPLAKLGYMLQKQPYDHVLRDDERKEAGFESVAEYIARNPERAGLVPEGNFREYKYTSWCRVILICLLGRTIIGVCSGDCMRGSGKPIYSRKKSTTSGIKSSGIRENSERGANA